jgi:CubicO group peptidase (beta-lactamase class C family)
MVAHGGSQAGTSTFLMLLPKRKVAVAVFTNRDGADVRAVAKKMAETVLGSARPGNAEPKKKPAKKDSVRYASVASRTAGTR